MNLLNTVTNVVVTLLALVALVFFIGDVDLNSFRIQDISNGYATLGLSDGFNINVQKPVLVVLGGTAVVVVGWLWTESRK